MISDLEMEKEALCFEKKRLDKSRLSKELQASSNILRRGLKERGARVLQFGNCIVGITGNGRRLFVKTPEDMNKNPVNDGEPF